MILPHVVIVAAFCCVEIPICRVTSIAAGQNTTFFLARPNDKYSDLPRHPADLDTPQDCIVCSQDNGEDDSPLECDKVPISFVPPLSHEARWLTHHLVYLVRLSVPLGVFNPAPGRYSRRRMVLPPLFARPGCTYRTRGHPCPSPTQGTKTEETVPRIQG